MTNQSCYYYLLVCFIVYVNLDAIVACALCIVDVVYICKELWALDRKDALLMSVIIINFESSDEIVFIAGYENCKNKRK